MNNRKKTTSVVNEFSFVGKSTDSDLNDITVVDTANVIVRFIWKFDVHHTV